MPPSADPNASPTSKLVTSGPATPASTPTASTPRTTPSDAPPPEHHGHGHGKNPFTRLASSYSGNVTAAVYDANTGQTYVLHPGVEEYTASIVKVEIMGTLLHHDQLHGGGLPFGNDASLLTSMIEASDNSSATQLLAEVGGPPAVKLFDESVGMTATEPHNTTPYINNDPGLPAWGLTTTTAQDEVKLVRAFAYGNPVLATKYRNVGINLMRHIEVGQNWGVTSGVGSSAVVALKNGWLPVTNNADWQVDSIGWIVGSGRNYVLAVLTKHNTSEQSGIDIISNISQTVYRTLG